jgi:hypothetical protein
MVEPFRCDEQCRVAGPPVLPQGCLGELDDVFVSVRQCRPREFGSIWGLLIGS